MRILVVGGGGREHAIVHYLSRSRHRPEIFVAHGNAGTAELATNVSLPASDIDKLLKFAKSKDIDLTIVGPEQPLTDGIVDAFESAGLQIVGPSAAAAQLEGSKAFSKGFMSEFGIPTAEYRNFQRAEYEHALAFIRERGAPIVIKASGLAAGKGAVVCETLSEAEEALRGMMLGTAFGDAADEIVIEEFMSGEEASLFVLCDGTGYCVLPTAQDHKRIGDGDTGPNTGGMGAYAPAPVMTAELVAKACAEIVEPTLRGMLEKGSSYKGFLYVGLMISPDGALRVVEYNCRLGDPETQAVLPLLKTDGVDLFMSCVEGKLSTFDVEVLDKSAAVVVMASAGYPGAYRKGHVIEGLSVTERGISDGLEGTFVYHAGTTRTREGTVVSNGGRVLGVTGVGDDLASALNAAYARVGTIRFDGAQYRNDIGHKGLERLASTTQA
jgi:phosphoribosylamine--glycine ligase